MKQSIAKSFASVADPPLPKMIELAASIDAFANRDGSVGDFFGFFLRDSRAQKRVIVHFHPDGGGDFARRRRRFPASSLPRNG